MQIFKRMFFLFVMISFVFELKAELRKQDKELKYELKLKTGSIIPERLEYVVQKKELDADLHCFDAYYYTILQFNNIPTIKTIEKLKLIDVHLGNYLPENAYRAKISAAIDLVKLKEYDVRSIYFLKPADKISAALLNKHQLNKYTTEAFKTEISITYDEALTKETVEHEINKLASKKQFDHKANKFLLKCTKKEIDEIAKLPFIYSINLQTDKFIPLAESATAQIRGRYFHNPIPDISPKLTGKGIKVGVIDRLTNHIDMKNRIIDDNCLTVAKDDGHGSLTKGLIAGNGNIDPVFTGMAPESIIVDVRLGEESSLEPFIENEAIASAHPYGNMQCPTDSKSTDEYEVCPMGLYDEDSQALDNFFKSNPYHLGIYSAGNSGNTYTNTCSNTQKPVVVHDYPLRFNTLVHTGQTAKNTLTVGGITNLDRSSLSSSRGPTRDGRLKPELVAEFCVAGTVNNNEYGTICGTSFSAPLVAGGVALLGEAYEKLEIDEDGDGIPDLPKAGLVKAILCNTADDLGNPGPDFTFGFGRPNFKRAYESLVADNYGTKTISSSDLNGNQFNEQINLTIPDSVFEVNVTLYWADTAGDLATGNEAYKLVNDLDLSMYSSNESNLIYNPFVLDNGGIDNGPNPTEMCADGTKNTKHINVLNDAIISTCNNETDICTDQNGNEITTQTSDHLNNIEKITIKNPDAGNWVINVDGLIREANFTELEYFVVYEFKYEGLEMSYPRGGESFEPGKSFYITWETVGEYDGFEVHYKDVLSTNPNSSWIPIETEFSAIDTVYSGTNLPANQLFYRWNIPEDFQHTRVSICITGNKTNGETDRVCTQQSLNIISTPTLSQQTNYQNQTVTLQWPTVTGADRYEVYELKEEKMEEIATVLENLNGNSFTANILPNGESSWFSVKAIDDVINGAIRDSIIVSKRAAAVEVVKEFPGNFYIKIFLEGGLNDAFTEHRTDLYDLELLRGMPHNLYTGSGLSYVPPYGIAPWNYVGTEGFNLTFFQDTVPYQPTDVDWVFVSLRDSLTKDTEVISFPAILTKDGSIRLDDPITKICDIGDGPFYIVVEHRNHLPVITPQAVDLIDGALLYDFTQQNSYHVFNLQGQKLLPNGKWAAFAGNSSQDQTTDALPQNDRNDIWGPDKDDWDALNGKFRLYDPTDTNLDGDINGADKGIWFNNNGISSGVPQ